MCLYIQLQNGGALNAKDLEDWCASLPLHRCCSSQDAQPMSSQQSWDSQSSCTAQALSWWGQVNSLLHGRKQTTVPRKALCAEGRKSRNSGLGKLPWEGTEDLQARRGSCTCMDTGRIPGSIRMKWRRLRARADLPRLQKQTKIPRNC